MRSWSLGLSCWMLVAACSHRTTAESPRFGSLTTDYRAFHFEPGIEVRDLPGGMRLAMMPDPRTNLVTIDVRYAVGAAADPPGRAGLAHLVEHLLFAIQSAPGGPTLGDELGELALSYNAWTTADEIDLTTTAPAGNLDALIALEARRMQATCEQLDPAIFVRERNVVLAEEAERATALDGVQRELLASVYGADHPYARGISGQIGDVERAEACAFMTSELTPARAVLVIAGPIDVDATAASVERRFAAIARPAATDLPAIPAPRFDGHTSEHTAPIEHPTAVVLLPHPAWGAGGRNAADLAAAHVAGALSRAADELPWLHTSDLALMGGDRAPVLAISVAVEDAAHLDDAVELVFTAAGEALRGDDDLGARQVAHQRGRGQLRAVAAWDRLATRGARIADYLQYTEHRYFMLRDISELASVTDAELRGVLGGYRRDRAHVVLVRPTGDGARVDRVEIADPSRTRDQVPWRAPIKPGEARRPLAAHPPSLVARLTTYDLGNGLHVILAPDPRSPVIDARVVFPGGIADEPRDRPGLAVAAASLLDHDYQHPYGWRDYDRVAWGMAVGTQLTHDVGATTTTFTATGLSEYADWHVWELSWLLDQGVYDDEELARLRKAVDKVDDDDDDATDQTTQRLRERLFGAGHPYTTPPWRKRALLAIGRTDLERWRDRHYRAGGATLIVSGGFDLAAMRAEIDELFAPWRGHAAAPAVIAAPAPPPGPSWLAEDDDDRAQIELTVAFPAASDAARDQAARAVLALVVEDRMRVVRDGMGASYGVDVRYRFGTGAALVIDGDVDPVRAGAVLVRVLAELDALRAGGDAVEADFARARRRALVQAQAYAGGASETADVVQRLVAAHQPLDRPATLAVEIAHLTPDDLMRVVAADLERAHMVVQVAGPASAVAATFAAAGATPER